MKYRDLGKTGFKVSEVGFGSWAIGGDWGTVNDDESTAVLERAVELGINFFDTADVYGMGRSEKLVSRFKKLPDKTIIITIKAGRILQPHIAAKYTSENIRRLIEDSLKNMKIDFLDLLQLHCPPTEVYYKPELFQALDKMQLEGLIKNYGVSVEKVEEALKAIEYTGVRTVQIIFNIVDVNINLKFSRLALFLAIGVSLYRTKQNCTMIFYLFRILFYILYSKSNVPNSDTACL